MTEKKKRGRPRKIVSSFKELKEAIDEGFKPVSSNNGRLVVTDQIDAAALARHPKNASAKDEVPFPENWDKMGKIDRLQWLTAHKK